MYMVNVASQSHIDSVAIKTQLFHWTIAMFEDAFIIVAGSVVSNNLPSKHLSSNIRRNNKEA